MTAGWQSGELGPFVAAAGPLAKLNGLKKSGPDRHCARSSRPAAGRIRDSILLPRCNRHQLSQPRPPAWPRLVSHAAAALKPPLPASLPAQSQARSPACVELRVHPPLRLHPIKSYSLFPATRCRAV
ncbi:hypothetical protein DPEC_G00348390 [Dallia pectoralis]|uniref:Uncharacterized protein n=1 Tax=Dallia pectoralis TaxID=75939 RepID=A0ACC2F174_DALPE|nr:hypothetical protein DPEC_G00348390 [Dallia pectoralis]